MTDPNDLTDPSASLDPPLLARTAERLESRPEFVAFRFAQVRAARGISTAELAETLGCSVEHLHRMSLCTLPRTDEDVLRIARVGGVERETLAEMLR